MRIAPNTFWSILFVLILAILPGYAAPTDPPSPTPPPPPGFPIDGGLVFLFVAAVLLGLYKLRKINKKALI